jgi:hypothetical protein
LACRPPPCRFRIFGTPAFINEVVEVGSRETFRYFLWRSADAADPKHKPF